MPSSHQGTHSPGQASLPGQDSHQPGNSKTDGTIFAEGQWQISHLRRRQGPPKSMHQTTKSCLTHLTGEDFIAAPSEAPSALANQSRSSGYALKPCPSATGRTNTTDPHKTSVLHSVIQPVSRNLHPPCPKLCNKKGPGEAGAHMADEGKSPKRGGWMFGSRNGSTRVRTALGNTAWHGTSCACERLGSTFTAVKSSSSLALPGPGIGAALPLFDPRSSPQLPDFRLVFP